MSNIKFFRVKANVTQSALAEEVGVKQTAVVKWEKGVSYPSVSTAIKLCDFFGCTLDELLREDGETNVECK